MFTQSQEAMLNIPNNFYVWYPSWLQLGKEVDLIQSKIINAFKPENFKNMFKGT